MPGEDEGAERLVRQLRDSLRENRRMMEELHADLRRERKQTPPWFRDALRRLENIERDLYGNGRDGIKATVTRLKDRSVRVKGDGEMSWKFLAAVVSGIAMVVAAAVSGLALILAG